MSGANRASVVDRKLVDAIRGMVGRSRRADPDGPVRPGSRLSGRLAIALFEAQVTR